MISKRMIDAAKRHHLFSDWCGLNRLDINMLLRGYFVRPELLPNLNLHRSARSSDERYRHSSMMWRAGRREDHLVRLLLYECATRQDAHEVLIEVLATMHSPQALKRERGPSTGDVVFRSQSNTARLFARGNLVVFLGSVGATQVDVVPLSELIDHELIARPESGGVTPAAAASRQREELHVAANEPTTLPAEPTARVDAEDDSWQKVICSHGELSQIADGIHYSPSQPGADRIEISHQRLGQTTRRWTYQVHVE